MRLRLLAYLSLLGILINSHLAFANSDINQQQSGLPDNFSVKYTLYKGALRLAEMTRKLKLNGDGSYAFESFSEPVGYARWFTKSTLLERSTWIYHDHNIRPLTYSYDRTGDKKERHVKLDFNWEKGRVTNTVNNDPWSMEIPEDTLDKLLYQLALMRDLQLGKEGLNYQVADGGTMKEYQFEVLGTEQVKTKLGVFDAIKLKNEGRRTTILWCATKMNYIPVRIEQKDDRGELHMTISHLDGIAIPPK